MKTIQEQNINKVARPVKVIQFGEGNFLRGFADYMIDVANEKGVFDGSIAMIKPIAWGNVDTFQEQNNLYTVTLRGKLDGNVVDEHRIITSIHDTIDPFTTFEAYGDLAKCETLEFVISNTTEAGIVYNEADKMEEVLNCTYPGKLTKFLLDRYNHFNGDQTKGLVILPVELIEHNGTKLKECILKYAQLWQLEEGFVNWIENNNIFCNTLVDRIVTGYPKEAEQIFAEVGYTDKLLVVAEPFGLWVIEGPEEVAKRFPLDQAGMNLVFTDNLKPYRERKVKLLNGAHTGTVLAGFLAGQDIVRGCMEDQTIRTYMEQLMFDEIAPTINLPQDDVKAFAEAVIERFENPFIDHSVLAISLNSVSKWKARILPSMKDYVAANGKLPKVITFSFAALMAFYYSS
ncbi:MAG: tagaturonate reductase, partial [Cellulosilyticaceae bacterium]